MAAYSRENIDPGERVPFYFFVDEFQNFTSSDIGPSLSECRKYKLKMILANQTLDQINERTLGPLLGNVGNLILFRPGVNDYKRIEPYFFDTFSRNEILNLPNYYCIARMQIDNVPAIPFIFKTMGSATF